MSNESALTRIAAAKKARHNMIMLCEPSSLPEFHRLIVETVEFDGDKDGGDIYYHSTSKKHMIHFKGLSQLALAAGIEWDTDKSRPTTVQKDYLSYQAVGFIRREFNKMICFRGDCEMDMEALKEDLVDEYEAKAKKDNRKNDKQKRDYVKYCVDRDFRFKRKHRIKLAATSAKSVVISKLLGLKSGYTKQEIDRPFTIVRCVVAPDLSDPDMQRQISMQMINGVFGRQQDPVALPPADAINVPHHTVEEDEPEPPPRDVNEAPFETEEIIIPGDLLEFREFSSTEQDAVLEHLVDQKGYNRARLGAPISDFEQKYKDQFFSMLIDLPDAVEEDIPF